jgi:hypothetical protein
VNKRLSWGDADSRCGQDGNLIDLFSSNLHFVQCRVNFAVGKRHTSS